MNSRTQWSELAQLRPFDVRSVAECEEWLGRISFAQAQLLEYIKQIAIAEYTRPLQGLLKLKSHSGLNVSPFEATNQLAHAHATVLAAKVVLDHLAPRCDQVHLQPTGTGLTKAEVDQWGHFDVTGCERASKVLLGEVSAASASLEATKGRHSKKKFKEAAPEGAQVYLFTLGRNGELAQHCITE